ncbi:RNA methyltransferase [Flavipsychrobacter stenotrophus]|uniref:RNA methyltransferase n=1 Tax=Flavipsychrobacter stenotrophus TaxID=2077091 RepID=A0A2S7T0J7_9BACT|nr:RNA methyltransferase [Flavipsychrobacter stenotrophus]PQJ12411.1 RNA methyltransferase [Flavipsychrobacter stenotrophus]
MNLPDPLLIDLRKVQGFDESSFQKAHDEPVTTSVRLHPIKRSGTDISGDAIPWSNGGIYLAQRPVFTLDPAFHGGAYYVQEASSMFLEHVWNSTVPQTEGLRVLDLCAAPGGKSTLIASLLTNDSLLISNEVIRARATILEENIVRWGYTNNWVTCNDPRDFTKLGGYFDVIVIDAPCSGSGLFRKDQNALRDWTEANVDLCSARQQRILADVWPALKENGLIIYATCSFSPQEDEDILDWIANEYKTETVPVSIRDEWGIVETRSPKHKMHGYRFFPGKAKGEGFFISAIRKKESASTLFLRRAKAADMSKIKQQAGHLLANDNLQYIQPDKESYNAIAAAHEADWQLLQKLFYFRRAGLPLGAPSAKDWIPAHDVALSIDANLSLPAIDVTREQALKFLKREDMNLDSAARGWQIIKFNNLGLGWIKSLQNRANNHLPKNWRIRMEIPET